MITEELIFQALKSVQDPDLHKDIVSLGFVKDIVIDGGKVAFKIELTTPACPVKDLLKQQSHDAVAKISGVTSVEIIMTSRIPANKGSMNQSNLLPGVKNVIAVASGKGG
ncbi:MAG TPA: iron-sulfur cluster assembly protein, partial [bacterium]|nr:iron-sulfur cluster assembly protein [bacterium]